MYCLLEYFKGLVSIMTSQGAGYETFVVSHRNSSSVGSGHAPPLIKVCVCGGGGLGCIISFGTPLSTL